MHRLRFAVLAGLLAALPTLAHSEEAGNTGQAANADAAKRRLVIFNHTKAELLELYASPIESKSWDADQLGAQKIGAGGKVTVNFGATIQGCSLDLMMVFGDGEKVIRRANVCEATSLIVSDSDRDDAPVLDSI